MDLTPALIAATASLLAAGLAATVSLVITILSKEQKTSEFRQQWVDALRNDVAALVAEAETLGDTSNHEIVGTEGAEFSEYVAKRYANMVELRMLLARTRLRLNPTKHSSLLAALDGLYDSVAANDVVLKAAVATVLSEATSVLKENWERVKKGEPAFFWTKRTAIGIVVCALISIGILVVRAWAA
ncbi:hypothetical protein [Variovorax fucosicus]|uniref:hypothetical protein n=1 Tax=Variovorax fucosicus TaxID=3053517 RepID=UPI00257742A7|nr:hypothetical protein [Variovorax sp. J22G47]MDM0056292.1 hypothetical protein [Variovorax sp. J22G47]